MISLDKILLLEEKVESAVKKITQLQLENDALRKSCAELTNSLSEKSERLLTYEQEQSKIESGIIKALDRLNTIENSVLNMQGQGQVSPAQKTEPQPIQQEQSASQPVQQEKPEIKPVAVPQTTQMSQPVAQQPSNTVQQQPQPTQSEKPTEFQPMPAQQPNAPIEATPSAPQPDEAQLQNNTPSMYQDDDAEINEETEVENAPQTEADEDFSPFDSLESDSETSENNDENSDDEKDGDDNLFDIF